MKLLRTCALGIFFLYGITVGFSKQDWELIAVADTMIIYLNQSVAGKLSSNFLVKNNELQTHLKLVTEMASGSSTTSMTITETRRYDFLGDLLAAYQEISGPAGKNFWTLQKKSTGEWELSVNAGGTENRRIVDDVRESILSTGKIYMGIRDSSIRAGESWNDTAFELTSGSHIYTITRCIQTPFEHKGDKWIFKSTNNLNGRDELWEIDKRGKTILRELYPFIARKETGNETESGVVNLFEEFSIKVKRQKSSSERICVTLDSSLQIDSSVGGFYTKDGTSNILKSMSQKCAGGLLAREALADSLVTYTTATSTMQVADSAISSLAASLKGKQKKSCELVRDFNHYVYKKIKKRNTATFSSALETLSAGFGDCGEHSVLLAALLRSAGIPARVVLGLVYMNGGYYYHAWVMAFTGKWIFVDPSHDVFPANHDRIPLLIDDTGEKAIQLSRLIGRVKIEYR